MRYQKVVVNRLGSALNNIQQIEYKVKREVSRVNVLEELKALREDLEDIQSLANRTQ